MIKPLSQHFLVVNALGSHSPRAINELIRVCTQSGCNLLTTKINLLGNELSAMLFIEGNWRTVAKLEAALPPLEKRLDLQILTKRSFSGFYSEPAMPYLVNIVALDKNGMLHELVEFFSRTDIPIEEISANSFTHSNKTQACMISIKINIPANVHLASFRDQLMTYCDNFNLDIFMEPYKP
ncbi:MAG: glycine cleavage system protein [Francisellaceae bacterium]|nr:glycine cleavage system protein [Francisellaceae bacterium]